MDLDFRKTVAVVWSIQGVTILGSLFFFKPPCKRDHRLFVGCFIIRQKVNLEYCLTTKINELLTCYRVDEPPRCYPRCERLHVV